MDAGISNQQRGGGHAASRTNCLDRRGSGPRVPGMARIVHRPGVGAQVRSAVGGGRMGSPPTRSRTIGHTYTVPNRPRSRRAVSGRTTRITFFRADQTSSTGADFDVYAAVGQGVVADDVLGQVGRDAGGPLRPGDPQRPGRCGQRVQRGPAAPQPVLRRAEAEHHVVRGRRGRPAGARSCRRATSRSKSDGRRRRGPAGRTRCRACGRAGCRCSRPRARRSHARFTAAPAPRQLTVIPGTYTGLMTILAAYRRPPAGTTRGYSVHIATEGDQVRAAQALRHKIFAGELGAVLHSPGTRPRHRPLRRRLRPPADPGRADRRGRRHLPDAAARPPRAGCTPTASSTCAASRRCGPDWWRPDAPACTRTTAPVP